MSVVEVLDLSLAYGKNLVVEELNLSIPQGQITVLIGGNGSGKSTLLRGIARLMRPEAGSVILSGRDIASLPTKEVARRLAILPQAPVAPEGLTVMQLVRQGRYPHQNWLQQWTREDEVLVREALRLTHVEDLAGRPVDSLSGGQRQRAWIAMTLAQNTPILLLDEPTTYLDLAHQIEVLDLLYDLNEREGRTIVMVLHDINLASRYAHHMVAVRDGRVFAKGSPEEVLNEVLIREVFCLECRVTRDPVFGCPLCIALGKGRRYAPGMMAAGTL